MSRKERVESLLKQEIASIVQTKLGDNRVGFVTITEVDVSPDLRHAKVYFSLLDKRSIAKTKQGLSSAANFIRSELCKVIRIQRLPNLTFHYDDSLERGVELSTKIDKLKESDDDNSL